jgi:elongation factor P
MITTNEFRTGATIELDGDIYTIIDFQHVKPGKGAAFVRTKLKNIKTGGTVERTFRAGEKLARAHIERREMQFLYFSGDEYVFMDISNYEQIHLTKEDIGEGIWYLKENTIIGVMIYQLTPIGVDLPNTVDLMVTDTAPGVKGDTAAGGTKPATLETGYVVQVPFFVNEGDVLRIDTRSGQYVMRV